MKMYSIIIFIPIIVLPTYMNHVIVLFTITYLVFTFFLFNLIYLFKSYLNKMFKRLK